MLNAFQTKIRSRVGEEGFTLVELAWVVVIIGILAAIATPIYLNQQKTAISSVLQQDVTNTASVLSQSNMGSFDENFNPCLAENFDKYVRSSDAKNIITCTAYHLTDYELREWCVQGERTVDIQEKWNYSSRTHKIRTGDCAPASRPPSDENIG